MILEKCHELFQAQVQVVDKVGATIVDESLVLRLQLRMVGKSQTIWIKCRQESRAWWCVLSF